MSRQVQDIAVWDYDGPQGSFGLELVESSTVNRSTARTRVKTMNRQRRPIAFQSGVKDVSITLSVIPETGKSTEVNWTKALDNDEYFTLVAEKGIDGLREQFQDCMVVSVNDSHNENGEARQEVSIEGLIAVEESV